MDIESVISAKDNEFSVKTTVHIHRLFEEFGFDGIFGRSICWTIKKIDKIMFYKDELC